MKLATISEKGCLGLKEFECKPGKFTLIKGAKGVGKTSVVENLKMFFTNKFDRSVFVNSDSEKGEILLTFDDGMTAKKIYHPAGGTPYANIDKDGMKPKSPEKYLKSLMSDAQINPVSFIGLSEKEQTETVLNSIEMKLTPEQVTEIWGEIPEGIGTEQHALKLCKAIENLYFGKRTTINAEIKGLKANIADLKAKLPEEYDVEKWRDAKATDVMKEINEATEHNKYVANCTTLIEQAATQKESIQAIANAENATRQAQITGLLEQIERLKSEQTAIADKVKTDCAAVDEKAKKAKEWLDKNKEIEIQPLQDKAEEIETMKGFVLSADDLFCKETDLEKKETEEKDLSFKIDLARSQPAKLLKSAKMPIEGLGIDDAGNISINGRPIKNLSDGEKIEFALNIAKATSGPLKLILINGFEALNPAEQQIFIDSVTDDEYQYIITCVADGELNVTTGEHIVIERPILPDMKTVGEHENAI